MSSNQRGRFVPWIILALLPFTMGAHGNGCTGTIVVTVEPNEDTGTVTTDSDTGMVDTDTTAETGDTGGPCVPTGAIVFYDNVDDDCDGWLECDQDADGVDGLSGSCTWGTDCDDTDPSAQEVTDWYVDVDGDTYTDPDVVISSCGSGGLAAYRDMPSAEPDCDDLDEDVHPGASDVLYNDIDEDCDGTPWCDSDGDGYDGVECVGGGDDCDDLDEDVHPDATEIWYDDVDQDCDSNDCDSDLDGHDAVACGGLDCNDIDANVHPGHADSENDCDVGCDADGDLHESVACGGGDCDDNDPYTYDGAAFNQEELDGFCTHDFDLDGYGAAHPDDLDDLPPEVVPGTDCNDSRSDIYLNEEDPEANHVPGDPENEDEMCERHDDRDGDGYCNDGPDGWCFGGLPSGDCEHLPSTNDVDASVNPGVAEIAGDGIDNNCDGTIDENGGPVACAAGTSRMKFVYVSEPAAAGIVVSAEQNNTGMLPISEGSPAGWHMTSALDAATNVTTVTVWNDTCTSDGTLWQASAAFNGGWSCMGGVAPFTTHGTWQVYEDDVLGTTTYVVNGVGGCELQVN